MKHWRRCKTKRVLVPFIEAKIVQRRTKNRHTFKDEKRQNQTEQK